MECYRLMEEDDHAREQALERELIDRAAAGDQRAFRQLVDRYQRRAYGVAYGILRDPDQAMDVAQDAFVKVYTKLPEFEHRAGFFTWLYRIVVNLCIDRKRKAARRREVEFDDTWSQPAEGAVDGPTLASIHVDAPDRALGRAELREHMSRAMDALSDGHQEILVLRELDGRSYEEIAEILEVPKGTVMSRLFHARKKFQEHLRHYLSE